MSLTIFFTLCILSIDFMIYFFFKLVYGEKHRAKPRGLPRQFHTDASRISGRRKPSSLYSVSARKSQAARASHVITMPPRDPSSAANH